VKIKLKYDLLILNIINFILILIIVFFPTNILRIILGIPFVLFFPGYSVIAALYPKKDAIENANRLMLSFALSIAVVPLILLLLNFTSWGINLIPILYSLAGFTFITSVIAWFRRKDRPIFDRFSLEFELKVPVWRGFWKGDIPNRILSIILILAIAGAIGILTYVIMMPSTQETYTEFYILNENSKAINYPHIMKYGGSGTIVLGIVNHEETAISYRVVIKINGLQSSEVGPITLKDEEKWENEVVFTPTVVSTNQKVEFILYKEGKTYTEVASLHIWIDVIE